MIRILRNIRQRLLVENRLGKYLIYAIGEILIIICGVLFAVQINNWNQSRISEKKITGYLQEIKSNLEDEIKDSEYVIEFYNKRDSLLILVLTNKITKQDLECYGYHCPINAITTWSYLDINRNAYNNLILVSGEIPSRFKTLYEDLYVLYDADGAQLKERKDKLYSQMSAHFNYLRDNKEWYSDIFLGGKLNDDAIDYFIKNPFYKNYAMEYYDDAVKLKAATKNYKEQAELVLKKIIELEDK
jgi:hypothetical protein